ncbi:MAG: ABC transporter permease, partial [Acidimicrobiales bacterium]
MIAPPLFSAAASGPVIPHFSASSSCVLNNGTFCAGWFVQHWGSVFEPALIQHIELTVVAVGIGFVISTGLAIAAHRRRWLAPPITFVTGVLYTIPSLAEFVLLVPITGLSRTTIEIPLVSYTLLLLFTNT